MDRNSALVRDYNNRLSQVYDTATTASDTSWTSPREVADLALPHVLPEMNVLDIGIGTGQSAEPIAARGARITGIDISPEMLKKTQDKHPEWKLFEADISAGLPPFDTKFDIVIASGMLEFVPNLQKIFSEVSQALSPKGYFCFTYEECLGDHPIQNDMVSELSKGLDAPASKATSFLVYRRTPAEVSELLTAYGFSQISSRQFTAYYKTDKKIPVIYQVVLAQKF